jgi:hypothetical protein
MLVFCDESATNRRTTRRPMAWAPEGERARRRDFFVKGEKLVPCSYYEGDTDVLMSCRRSVLPAICLDGVLHFDVLVNRSWNGDDFYQFVDTLTATRMNPYPDRNSVLVMDNCSIHHAPGIQALIRNRSVHVTFRRSVHIPNTQPSGMRLIYLPPYSPDFNPIEEGFSAMKAWIRRNYDYAVHELTNGDGVGMIAEAIRDSMTPENIHGWFRDCGYI